jgi:hypothetical protein
MTSTHALPLPGLASRCYRLTPGGRACVDTVNTKAQATGSLSRYLHDVLEMCGTGVWFEQLQQFMPPRSLDESLRSLLALGLIETVDAGEAPHAVDVRRPDGRQRYPGIPKRSVL